MTLPYPILETARLRLVLPAAEHLQAHVDFLASDRAAARGWGALPHDAWRSFAAIIGHRTLRGFGPFIAEAKSDGHVVGIFGPWHPGGQPEGEIKWSVWPAADEGKGLAYEAALAARAFAWRTLGWTKAVSYINPDNLRSAALARRLGAVPDHQWTTPRGTMIDVWRHPAPEALA